MMNTKIVLQHPIKVDGVEVSELSLRRPKVRDLQKIESVSGEISKVVALASALADLSPEQVAEIDAADFVKISEAVAGFLG